MSPLLRTIVPTLAALAVIATTLSLGHWQTRRAEEKLALQAAQEAARQLAPQPISAQPLAPAQAAALEGRPVRVTGHWLAERSVYLDNRSHQGIAGFHLLTPLRIAGGPGEAMHVLVLRGWVPRDPQVRTRLLEPPLAKGEVMVVGVAQRELGRVLELAAMPAPAPDQRIWPNLTLDAYGQWSGLRLQPVLVRQTEPAPGQGGEPADELTRNWPAPGLDVDKHRGYAFQWYALAVATAGLWLWFVVWLPSRQRRKRLNAGS